MLPHSERLQQCSTVYRASDVVLQKVYFKKSSLFKVFMSWEQPFACASPCWQVFFLLCTFVSPDSYIANQSSFFAINDKDLNKYKNLRNLWVLYECILLWSQHWLLNKCVIYELEYCVFVVIYFAIKYICVIMIKVSKVMFGTNTLW